MQVHTTQTTVKLAILHMHSFISLVHAPFCRSQGTVYTVLTLSCFVIIFWLYLFAYLGYYNSGFVVKD